MNEKVGVVNIHERKGHFTYNSVRSFNDVNQFGNGPESMLFCNRLRRTMHQCHCRIDGRIGMWENLV